MQLQAMNRVMKNQLRHNKFNLVILSKMTKLNLKMTKLKVIIQLSHYVEND